MGKICILSTVNIKHMTLISLYTNYLEKNNINYDIIYIDKYHEKEDIAAENIYPYQLYIQRDWSMPRKVVKYFGFKKYAKNLIKKNNYDFIIVWNGFTAFMFADFLSKQYKNRYCLNIRDYGYEKLLPVYLQMKKVIKNSAFTTISSNGFKKFLPKFDYITVNSLNEKILANCMPKENIRKKDKPIRISFIGYVRFFENDKKLINSLGNDNRFIVQFFGEGAQKLDEYVKENGYSNIICKGRFEPKETKEFLEKTDIINNLYGVGDIALDTALSIKLYYSVYMNIPILVYNGTYMSEIAEKYKIGFSIDSDGYDGLGDRLYKWYYSLKYEELKNNCNEFIKVINSENENFKRILAKNINKAMLNEDLPKRVIYEK